MTKQIIVIREIKNKTYTLIKFSYTNMYDYFICRCITIFNKTFYIPIKHCKHGRSYTMEITNYDKSVFMFYTFINDKLNGKFYKSI